MEKNKKLKIKKDKKNINKEEKTKKKKIKDPIKKKRRRRKIFKTLLNLALLFILLMLIASIIFSIYIVINAPEFNPDNLYRAEASIVYDKDNNQIAKLGVEKRKKVSYDQLPEVLVDAIIATEDSRYFQHNGFDLPRFTKAAAGQVVNKITRHGDAGGGSTISMQVVKNNYTSTKQTITRKFTDIYIAIFKLEKKYSKEEILEYYVNTPYLGNNSYGVEQACQSYFGKSVSDINLSEAAIIAGLFQAPSAYDPYRYPDSTTIRRDTVLYLMRMHGYITKEEEEAAKAIPVTSLLHSKSDAEVTNDFQSYLDIVIDEVIEKTDKNPYTTGMKIYTNLDANKQRTINDIMAGRSWTWKDDKIQAGIAVVNTSTGELVAIGGGRNQTGERTFNFATMINKQIGSTAKPLFDYGPAMEFNNFCESTPFLDESYTYSNGSPIKDWDNGYEGEETLKVALAHSRNIPALKAFQSVENKKIVEFVTSLGLSPEVASDGTIHEAHSLGAFNGSNPVQMAGAYAAFGNGGYYTKPYSVKKIEYIDSGKTVSLKNKTTKVMSDSTAYMITDALLYAVESYGNIGGSVRGVRLAAKTGTSNFTSAIKRQYGFPSSAVNDLWVVGYTPEYAVGLWYGYDKLETGYYNTSAGGVAKNKLFRQVVDSISDDKSGGRQFNVPSSVVKVTVEKSTYPVMLAGDNTPDDMKVTEYCKKGAEPTERSQRFNQLANPTGLTAKESNSQVNLSWNRSEVPNYLTDAYFKNYYKVFYAQHIDEKLGARNASLGSFGYEVFERNNSTGATTSLGFTAENTFSVAKKSYDATYIVKTTWQNDGYTASSGISVDVKGTQTTIEPKVTEKENKQTEKNASITFTGSTSTIEYSLSNKTFSNGGIMEGIVVTDENENSLGTDKLTFSCSKPCSANDGILTDPNAKAGDSYTITYKYNYNGKTITKNRTVKVTE